MREVEPTALVEEMHGAPSAPRWIDVSDPTPAELDTIASDLEWHALAREGLWAGQDRQRVQSYPGSVLLQMLRPRVVDDEVTFDRLQAVVGETSIVTVHDACDDLIDSAAADAGQRSDLGRNGAMGVVASLLDELLAAYDDAVGRIEDRVESEESAVLLDQRQGVQALQVTAATRTAVTRLRRASGQLRELIGVIVRRELLDSAHSGELDLELRDVLDGVIRIHEDLDMLHDRMTSLADTRLAMIAYRQNDITKRLSGWGAILIIPAIVTGWFGQNFHHLGALGWTYGPEFSLALTVGAMVALWLAFRRAGWL